MVTFVPDLSFFRLNDGKYARPRAEAVCVFFLQTRRELQETVTFAPVAVGDTEMLHLDSRRLALAVTVVRDAKSKSQNGLKVW